MAMNDGKFETSDTALAAYLYSLGIKLLRIDYTLSRRVTFVFAEPNDNVIEDYTTGQATGNIQAFYRAYRTLISKLKERAEA